jgi:DNA replication protein DnaC
VTRPCKTCGVELEYEPPTYRGRAVPFPGPVDCERCLERAELEERERRERKAREDAFLAPLRARQERRARMAAAAVPPLYVAAELDDFEVSTALEHARAVAGRDEDGLCATGPVGVGKTHLAAAVCGDLLMRREAIRWVSVPELFAQLRTSFGDDAHKAASEVVIGRGGIVLDDLDRGSASDFGCEVLYTVINGRIEAGAPLIVTTNMLPEQLAERLGDAIVSRLVGYCRVVEMAGVDRRLALARQRRAAA